MSAQKITFEPLNQTDIKLEGWAKGPGFVAAKIRLAHDRDKARICLEEPGICTLLTLRRGMSSLFGDWVWECRVSRGLPQAVAHEVEIRTGISHAGLKVAVTVTDETKMMLWDNTARGWKPMLREVVG